MLSLWPGTAFAQALGPGECAHPLQAGACFAAFSLVSVSYTLIAAAYAWGALVIMRPAFAPSTFRRLLWLCPLVAWGLSMLGFTLGGALGWLAYPHDASPFFFMDWFVALFLLLGQSLFVGLAFSRFGGRQKGRG